jgi:hypothetical protein
MLTLAQVKQALQAQGIELSAEAKPGKETALLGVQPTSFELRRPNDPAALPELLHVYVFRSAADREQGAEAFGHLYETAKLAFVPNEFDVRNVLLVYFSRSVTDARFLPKLRAASSSLEQM